jgi:hypothetical protein
VCEDVVKIVSGNESIIIKISFGENVLKFFFRKFFSEFE